MDNLGSWVQEVVVAVSVDSMGQEKTEASTE
jgi:hypothetical protein